MATDGVTVFAPLALLQDQYGDLFVADSSNRAAVYFQGLTLKGASFFPGSPLAPAVFASLCLPAGRLRLPVRSQHRHWGAPFPASLGDIQVTFSGKSPSTAKPPHRPAPLAYVSPGQINLIVPQNAPMSGTANVEVVQVSTGQVLGAGRSP